MYVGTLECDLLLGDVRSLKQKRSVVRPLVAEIRKKFPVSATEVADHDLYRRAKVGVAVVGDEAAHCREVLDACERLIAARPETELLQTRTRLIGPED